MTGADRSDARVRRAVLVLAGLLSLLSLIQANHRARKGRNALLKWEPAYERLERGEPLYGVPLREDAEEGYPTLPVTLLAMAPFRALGPTLGPLAWAAFRIALAWLVVWIALDLAAGRARDFPPWAMLVVVLLSFRVLHSDVQHGNLNLLVGAAVAGAAAVWARGRAFAAGLLFGLGACLKVTPALGLVWLAARRSGRGGAGFAVGVLLFAFVVPGLWLGFGRNVELAGAWWRQMVAPFLEGRELGATQTMQLNQSLLGVLARLATDSVAIEARPGTWPDDVRVHLLALGPGAFRALHLAASAGVLALLLAALAPFGRRTPDRRRVLGEAAVVSLAMLLLSERSWKHHHVLLPLAVAYLAWHAFRGSGAARRAGLVGLGVVTALVALTGEAVLGERGSDLAEAYGAFAWADLALAGLVAATLRRTAGHEAPAARILLGSETRR